MKIKNGVLRIKIIGVEFTLIEVAGITLVAWAISKAIA